MGNRPKISIVMPTYNVEKYFRQCIESVINQTLTDIEIIPVDDGSPDNCGAIMDEYAAKDSRIKPIHQENGGYGKAVNAGIEAATGEYIGIVETDDWLEPEMYEKLYNQAKKLDADVCKCGFYKYNSLAPEGKQNKKWKIEHQDIEIFPSDRSFTIKENPKLVIFLASIWSNIYKKEFLQKNDIKVNATRSASYQDFPFMVEVMCKAKKIAIVPEYFYHWRVEPSQNSSTSRNDKRLLIMAFQCEQAKRIAKELNLYDTLKEELNYHFYSANIGFYNVIQFNYKKDYYKQLRNLFAELKNDKSFEYKYFSKKQKRFVQRIINGPFWVTLNFKNLRKNIFSIRWNNREKRILLCGRILYSQTPETHVVVGGGVTLSFKNNCFKILPIFDFTNLCGGV